MLYAIKHDKRLKSVKEDSFTKLGRGSCLRIQSLSRKLNEVRVMQKSRVRIFQAGNSKAKNKIGVPEEWLEVLRLPTGVIEERRVCFKRQLAAETGAE